jgi:hypothetical protein
VKNDHRNEPAKFEGNVVFLSSMLFPVKSKPYGLSYQKWTARWWQWALSIPKKGNPLTDLTGEHSTEGQHGPVWFLAGTTGQTFIADRISIIPRRKAVLFPVLVSQFSFSETPYVKEESELISLTAKDIDHCSFLEAIIDGVNIPDIRNYRIQYGSFDLDLPDDNIWNIKMGRTRAASDGFWLFLKPLSEGDHTIEFHGVEPHFETHVRYHINVS